MAGGPKVRAIREGFRLTENAVVNALEATRDAERKEELDGKTAPQHLIEGIRSRVAKDVMLHTDDEALQLAVDILEGIEEVIPQLEIGTSPEERWARVRKVLDERKPKRRTRRRGGQQLDDKLVH